VTASTRADIEAGVFPWKTQEETGKTEKKEKKMASKNGEKMPFMGARK